MNIQIFISIVLFLLYSPMSYSCEKMKLYAIYTPSHEVLLNEFFLPSIQDDFDIVLEYHDQTCPSVHFMAQGWKKTTIRKVKLIIKAIKENWGEMFIFSDVDIQFFEPIEHIIRTLMHGKDLIIQKNNPSGVLCSGFFACRANEKTLRLWEDVKKEMLQHADCSDQKALNRCMKRHSKKNPYDIVWDYLPDMFFGAGTLTGQYWKPGLELPIPHDIVIHHANWTQGIDNKIKQLEYVRDVVEQRWMELP